jgi:hypothetical protein
MQHGIGAGDQREPSEIPAWIVPWLMNDRSASAIGVDRIAPFRP